MKNELEILCDVVSKLELMSIDYMLTGSMAMIYYAKPRMTRDIDLVIELRNEKAKDFITQFSSEYYLSEDSVYDSIENGFQFNLIHFNTVFKIGFIVKKSEEYCKIEFDRRRKVLFDKIEVYIVSKEDLIISKLIWMKDSGSEMQLNDIKNLIEGKFDKIYLESWVKIRSGKYLERGSTMNYTSEGAKKIESELLSKKSGY